MKKKLLIVAGIALCAALGTTYFFYNLISQQIAPVSASLSERIVVARRDLPRGTRIASEDIRLEEVRDRSVPPGTLRDAESLSGRFLAQPASAGEPLLDGHFPVLDTGGVSAAIPNGMRAVSVHVEEHGGVVRLLRRGDRVDVLAASGRRAPGEKVTVETLLENLEVLDTGQDSGDPRDRSFPVVTLLVQAEDAEGLSLADQGGAIRLVLRNPADEADLFTRKAPAPPVRRQPSRLPDPRGKASVPAATDRPAVREAEPVLAPEPNKVTRHVRFDLRLAGLGDAALAEFSGNLAATHRTAPLIVSSFKPDWDAAGQFEALRGSRRLEVFAEPALLTLDDSEALFEQLVRETGVASPGPETIGVRVTMIPSLQPEGRVRIRIHSQVIAPGPGAAASLAASRRTECEIEVADGQSFWIRGLVDRPGAWDLLRMLFPGRPLEKEVNDELVILVTPREAAREEAERAEISAVWSR